MGISVPKINGNSTGRYHWERRGGATYRNGNGVGGAAQKRRDATAYGDGSEDDSEGDGGGVGTATQKLYKIHPVAYLTFRGVPHDDTFENYAFHLQVEQLVHRRV